MELKRPDSGAAALAEELSAGAVVFMLLTSVRRQTFSQGNEGRRNERAFSQVLFGRVSFLESAG